MAAGLANQKVHIGAQMRLLYMVDVEVDIAPVEIVGWRGPGGASASQLFIRDIQMQPAGLDIHLYHISVLHQGQVPARPGLGRYVQEDRKSTRLNSSHVAISYAVF